MVIAYIDPGKVPPYMLYSPGLVIDRFTVPPSEEEIAKFKADNGIVVDPEASAIPEGMPGHGFVENKRTVQ